MFERKHHPADSPSPTQPAPGQRRRQTPAASTSTAHAPPAATPEAVAPTESPYAAITPRRSNRRAAAAIAALALLFACGWFGRDLVYPSLAHAVSNSSAVADAEPAGGGVIGLVTKTQLHPRGWPWLTVVSARVEGCLEAGSLAPALNLDQEAAEAGDSAGAISLCDIQPDAVYLAHGRFPSEMTLPPTLFVLSDAAPWVALEFDAAQASASSASSGESYTAAALPARLNSGQAAALVMFWRVELPQEAKLEGECWQAAGEAEPGGRYCVWDGASGDESFAIAVELRSAFGFVRTERLDLTGLAHW
ncbi:MAG: hypothetical protein LBD51_02425 [Bifidobacteriaceae bacterium]|jgi:hypothetical protein|nr:hypothetical protein [Bifidobacteriaceae bacterium]